MNHLIACLSGRLTAVCLVTLVLSACGGGGGGSDGGGFLPAPEPAPEFTLSLSLETSSGVPTSRVLVGQPAFLKVEVRENNDSRALAANVRVDATTDSAVISPSNGSALTNGEGIATFELNAGDSVGGGTVTVSIETANGTISDSINYQVGEFQLAAELVDASGQPVTFIAEGRPATLRVTVTEGGNPQSDVVVEVEAELAEVSPENGRAITDGTGVAIFTIAAGATRGADELIVRATGPASTPTEIRVPYQILGDDDRFALEPVLLNGDGAVTTEISPGNPGTLRVRLTRSNALLGIESEPVAGQILILESTDGVVTPANGQALTDGSGTAVFGLAAGDNVGAQTATVSVDGPSGTVSAEIPYQVVDESSGGAAFFSLTVEVALQDARGNPTTSVSAGAPATAVVRVLGRPAGTQQRQPVPGVVVSLTAGQGVISPLGGSAVTDASGRATFTVSAGTTAGTDVLSATVQGPSGPVTDSFVYEIDAATFAATLELLDERGRVTSTIRQGEPVTLRVVVRSTPDGQPVADALVQASTTVAALSPSNGRAITDRSGVATFQLTATDVGGGDTVEVVIEAESGSIVRSIAYQVLEPRFSVALRLLDENGVDTTLVTTARPATLRVDLDSLDSPPQPVSGIVATAEADFAVIAPESGTALTDAAGIAEFIVQAGELEGADVIRVSIDTGTGVIERTIAVQINTSAIRLGSFDRGEFRDGEVGFTVDELPFGGSTRVNLAIIDELGDLVTTDREVRLTSDCSVQGASGFREIGSDGAGQSALVVTSEQGLVEAEYVASSCEGEDRVTATLVGENLSAAGVLSINSLNANFIGFFSADPAEGPETGDRTVIALKSTGGAPAGRTETARVTFELLARKPTLAPGDPGPGTPEYLQNPDRVPLPGAEVSFTLTNSVAGITLSNPTGESTQQGSITATTDQDGLVTVEVSSGEVTAQTFVVASFEREGGGTTIDTTSNQIVVSTGLPDQNSLSLSVADGFYVPSAANVDGVERVITARLADRFNNPVPDGTSVVFRTEYGAIDSSCLTGQANGKRLVERGDAVPNRGTCSVLWTSENPRLPTFFDPELAQTTDREDYECPSHDGDAGPCPDDLGPLRLLRSTVVAYVLGEEDFTDSNGNGLYDQGEPFLNLPEAFIDFNEDGVYTPFAGSSTGCVSRFGEDACELSGAEEEFIDLDRDGLYGEGDDPRTGQPVYNGTLCTVEAETQQFCSRQLVNVRGDLVLTLSSVPSAQDLLFVSTATRQVVTGAPLVGARYAVYIADRNNNRPGNGGELTISLDDPEACEVFIAGETIGQVGGGGTGGVSAPSATTLTLNSAGDSAGALTVTPIVVTDSSPSLDGRLSFSIDGEFIGDIACN
jgi:hypothetical protein